MVQWLRLCALTAEGLGSIPGQGTKSPHSISCAAWQKIYIYWKIGVKLSIFADIQFLEAKEESAERLITNKKFQ